MDTQDYQREKRADYVQGPKPQAKGSVEQEVGRLLREGKNITQKLRDDMSEKHKDREFVDEVISLLATKKEKIRRKAEKFFLAIRTKYGYDYPFHDLLNKAIKHRKDLDLNEDEFTEFKRIYEMYLTGQKIPRSEGIEAYKPKNNMSRILGTADPAEAQKTYAGLNLKDDERDTAQEIIKIYNNTKNLWAQVFQQTITYRDIDPESYMGGFDPVKDNISTYIHPVIAAMFMPKIGIFERRMLYANLAGIIKARFNKEPLANDADLQMVDALAADNMDVVCDRASPIRDYKNRCVLQEALWKNVLSFRNGSYYSPVAAELQAAVDTCKLFNHDSPQTLFGGDECTIIKRLLNSFCIRPTVAITQTMYEERVFTGVRIPNATPQRPEQLSMIEVPIPPPAEHDPTGYYHMSLQTVLADGIKLIEDKYHMALPKTTKIIDSQGVVIFHVNRRYNQVSYGNYIKPMQYNFLRLPPTIAGFEKVNDNPVDFENQITIGTKQFNLRSVVAVIVEQQTKMIVGNQALVRKVGVDQCYCYNPRNAIKATVMEDPMFPGQNKMVARRGVPVGLINCDSSIGASVGSSMTFRDVAMNCGSIFIYEGVEGQEPSGYQQY
ncbi:MAG: putative core protein [Faunusvirus sp.]|jgi:hypothetical protein|uniref:Putative core protein n=1 Tax=Faunusvirus sp. TaxID=2487766 RepID=A0A3G4ZWL3_9VIRU|nr:MAG: putative core protein [Faunusvirus sp.]